jgi:hypothetical protein
LPDLQRLGEVLAEAQFGDDARNPLLWQLLRSRFSLMIARDEAPGGSLIASLRESARRRKKPAGMWLSDSEFYEALFQALLNRDAEFFREIARLLETRIDSAERRMDLEAAKAYDTICAIAERTGRPLPPTKKEIREQALFAVALANVIRRDSSAHAELGVYEESEEGPLVLRDEVRKEVLQEMERISEQNWTRIFKRCGLAHLPNDKGGQRSHRARRK